MLRALIGAAVLLVGIGCGGNSRPAPPPTEDAARIACDRFAARAIQEGDPAEAASLSARAAACYESLTADPVEE